MSLRRRGTKQATDRKATDHTGRHRAAIARLGRQGRHAHSRSGHQNDQTPRHD